jgi:hypothetical protein
MDRTQGNGESANRCGEVIDAIDQVIDMAREAADELVFLGRTERRSGRTAPWFAEDFQLELEWRVVPSLERLKRALRENDPQVEQAVAG